MAHSRVPNDGAENKGLFLLAAALSTHLEQQIDEVTEEINQLETSLRHTHGTTASVSQPYVAWSRPRMRRSSINNPVPGSTISTEHAQPVPMSRQLPSGLSQRPIPSPTLLPASRLQPVKSPSPTLKSSGRSTHKLNPEAPEFTSTPIRSMDSNIQHELNLQISATMQMAREFRKPLVEIDKFSGDPTRYAQFCRQFDTRIMKNCESYDECLIVI